MHIRTFLGLIALLVACNAMAQAYRWVDENGVVHYSDRPEEGAEQIQLPHEGRRAAQSLAARQAVAPTAAAAQAGEQAPSAPFKYDSIEVVAPAPEETLWNIEGVLNVAVSITPALRPEDQVRVYFDGEQRMVSGTNFQLQEVWRGVHNIQVEVVDATGRLMARSLPNRFYVQQNTIK